MADITDRQMSIKPGPRDIWLNESAPKGHGRFMARIRPNGERLFYYRYTDSTRARVRLPIGSYDRDGTSGLTLKAARQRARELTELYLSGVTDLREHLEAEEAARKAARDAEIARLEAEKAASEAALARQAARKTVSELFDHWARVDLINRKDGGAEVRRMFNKDVLPLIGHLAVEDVRKGRITEVTDKLLSRGVNRMAKLIFSLMRQMFRFAVDRDLIDNDPTASIRKAKIDEIRALAQQVPAAGLLVTSQAAIWIALSTCCRIGELLAARWEHVDLAKRTWTIPAENSKNKKAHMIALSDFAMQQFLRLREITGDSSWCYPNTDNSGPVCPKTVTKQIGDRQRAPGQKVMSNRSAMAHALLLPAGKWTPHDLRRTGATLMTMMGVLPEVAERCLNHTEENKVKRIYQRHSYAAEMAEAWKKLGTHLHRLTSEDCSNVVTLKLA
jgi:integrase